MLPKCQCKGCNNVGTVAVPLSRRGDRNAYICQYHAEQLEAYSRENMTRLGTIKANGFTFAQELETSFSDIVARMELLASGYLPTMDITVDCEYKSAITNGLNSLAKHCVTIDRLIANGNLSVADTSNYEVGTHLHIGHTDHIKPETIRYISRFYHSLFTPLSEAMKSDPQKTANLFGRYFGQWAQPINANSDPIAHSNFINLQHDYTIEFRILKYQNASQYMKAVHFCKDATITIINNFIVHFNDEPKDKRRYPTITAYRRHKAQTTAAKLVKLFEKYTA